MKVAVIGLDGVPPSLLFDQWHTELPNIDSLMARGTWGSLRSTHPPITVPAWTSMMSGRDPGELGLYGFRNRRSREYDEHALATSQAVTHDLVWDILSRAGRRVVLVGVPQTYPPRPVNGWMVSCFLTPSSAAAYTYPESLRAEVESVADGYLFDVDGLRTAPSEDLLARIHEKTRKHFAVAKHMARTRPWDFFMMVEMGTDRIHHAFWRYIDPTHPRHEPGGPLAAAILDYYRFVDREIGELLRVIGAEATVFVVSDHGACPMVGGIRVNEWLIRRGDLVLRGHPDTAGSLDLSMVDWRRTRAWAEGGYCARLFLNVRGREPLGTIDPAEYEAAREELIEAIEQIAGPEGVPLQARAHRPEKLYSATSGFPPDIIAYFGNLRWRALGSIGPGDIYQPANDTGPDDANHDWDGVFVMRAGDSDLGGRRLEGLHVMDMTPTILGRFGLGVPPGVRGRDIAEALRGDSSASRERAVPALGVNGASLPSMADGIRVFS